MSSSQPKHFSQVEQESGSISEEQAKSYATYVLSLFDKPRPTDEKTLTIERDFVFDFLKTSTTYFRKHSSATNHCTKLQDKLNAATEQLEQPQTMVKHQQALQESQKSLIDAQQQQLAVAAPGRTPRTTTTDASPRDYQPPSQPPASERNDERRIKMNELVTRPELFDGRPMPRKWIDKYRNAIRNNDWLDRQAVCYFSGFQREA